MREVARLHLSDCDSTQLEAKRWLEQPHPEHAAVVTATHQRSGFGRYGRSWQDRPGCDLLLSVAVRDPPPAGDAPLPVMIARHVAATIRTAVANHGGDAAELEVALPNDLVWRSNKVGGVLVDAHSVGSRWLWIVAGVGVNLLGSPFSIDGRHATSVEAAFRVSLQPEDLAQAVAPGLLGLLRGGGS